jgi:hypothetical protein
VPTSIAYPPGSALEPLTRDRPTLVVFLRHFGCTFCREALADVAKARAAIGETGTSVAFVHAVAPDEADPWFTAAGLADVARISDPTLAHYRAFHLDTTGLAALARPALWARGAMSAARHGFGIQPPDLIRQLPGVFVVEGSTLLSAFRHTSPSDRPDYLDLIRQARAVQCDDSSKAAPMP